MMRALLYFYVYISGSYELRIHNTKLYSNSVERNSQE